MNPSVACVMLVNGRAEMVKRAIASFHAQTYQRKLLVILDSGEERVDLPASVRESTQTTVAHWTPQRSIGTLRNDANSMAAADIIAHWDSDDWSDPGRLAEQVSMLKESQRECVGYRQAVIWDERPNAGNAYLYRNPDDYYCLGSSLCYWRSVWERRTFSDVSDGEDTFWLRGVESLGVDGFVSFGTSSEWALRLLARRGLLPGPSTPRLIAPRLICSIHGGNTVMREPGQGPWWSRAPQYDAHCKKVMEL